MKKLVIDGLLRNQTAAVSGALWATGAVGVQEDWIPGTAPPPRQPWDEGLAAPLPDRIRLLAWFEKVEPASVLAAIGRWLDAQCTVAWEDEPEVDWVQRYEDSLERIELPGVTLAPPHLAQPGDLILDPGCGFGTGEHPTTRQLLGWLPSLTGETLLDIGSGSGVLALAAARRGFRVHGTEIEEPARRNAARNAELNGLDVAFDDRQPAELAPVDVVLANLHAELLVKFATDLRRLARHQLLCAGILVEKEDRVLAVFAGRPLRQRTVDGAWVALWFGAEP